jgi:Mn-dependent DtxR family transcriptional regulator
MYNPSSASKMVLSTSRSVMGLVNFEKYGLISLTPNGKELGEYLLFRHNIVHKFLCLINSSTNELKQTELIEHLLDKRTVKNIEALINELEEKGIR